MLPTLLRPAAAFGGAGADKVALHVRQSAENGDHQSARAGAGVGPRLGERTKLRLHVHDPLDDAEQVKGAARKPVDPRHRHHVAGREAGEHPAKLAPVGARAFYLLAIDVPAAASGGAAIRRRDVDGETLRSIGRSYNVRAQTISRLTA
jgi:hypothetical protein